MMSKSCLVVDDSEVIRKVARHLLESMAFAVEEAEDGQEALNFCRRTIHDVILLAWTMTVMSATDYIGPYNDLALDNPARLRRDFGPPVKTLPPCLAAQAEGAT